MLEIAGNPAIQGSNGTISAQLPKALNFTDANHAFLHKKDYWLDVIIEYKFILAVVGYLSPDQSQSFPDCY